MPSKKAACLFIILLILLFLTGYSFSKRIRETREQSVPTSQAFSDFSPNAPSLEYDLTHAPYTVRLS